MDIHLATVDDIATELRSRGLTFALLVCPRLSQGVMGDGHSPQNDADRVFGLLDDERKPAVLAELFLDGARHALDVLVEHTPATSALPLREDTRRLQAALSEYAECECE